MSRSAPSKFLCSSSVILVQLQRSLQICRPSFFLAFEDHFQIHTERNLLRPKRIDRRKQRDNRRLVIRRRTRVNPPIVVIDRPMLRAVFRKRNPLSAGFDGRIAEHRFKRFSIRPCCRIGRLPVIVRVKNHRALRFRRNQLAENHRPAPGDRQQMRFDPPRLQHLDQVCRVLLYVLRVARDVRDGKEFAQLAHDAVLVVHPVVTHFLRDLRRRRRN